MTTDRTIEIFNDYDRINGILLRGNDEDDNLFNSETIEAMNNINVILHKYQKIQEIVERFKNQYDHTTSMDLMIEIREVIGE